MSEDELQEAVRDLCKLLGLAVFHVHDSRRSWGPGYPDLTIVGNRGVIWRELKSASGQLSGHQRQWMYRLRAAGQDWALWRPCDLHSGRIARELRTVA